MQRSYRFVFLSFLLFCLALGWVASQSMHTSPRAVALAQAQSPDPDLPAKAKLFGLELTPVDAASIQGHIESARAVDVALKQNPGLRDKPVKSITFGHMKNVELQKAQAAGVNVMPSLVDMDLVWVVSFDGLEEVSSGPPEAPRRVAHELNVVVDAQSGIYIMAFTS